MITLTNPFTGLTINHPGHADQSSHGRKKKFSDVRETKSFIGKKKAAYVTPEEDILEVLYTHPYLLETHPELFGEEPIDLKSSDVNKRFKEMADRVKGKGFIRASENETGFASVIDADLTRYSPRKIVRMIEDGLLPDSDAYDIEGVGTVKRSDLEMAKYWRELE